MTVDTNLEKLRLRIGDTDVGDSGANARFKDSELNYFLSAETTIAAAALAAVESWVAKKASSYDFETDGQSFKRSQESEAMLALAKYWRSLGVTTSMDSDTAGVRTVDVTKIDGWSDDIDNQDVTGTTDTTRRLNVYSGVDELP